MPTCSLIHRAPRRGLIRLVAVAAAMLAIIPSSAAAATWTSDPIQSAPAGQYFDSLASASCLSASWCMAVGDADVLAGGTTAPLARIWTGSEWVSASVQPVSGVTDSNMYGVSCIATNWCMGVGSATTWTNGIPTGKAVTWQWNGTEFALQSVAPSSGGLVPNSDDAVWCTSETHCIAVGGTTYGGPTADVWNGTGWFSDDPSTNMSAGFSGIDCVSAAVCYVVGVDTDGYFNTSDGETARYKPVVMEDDNGSWKQLVQPLSEGDNGPNAISCASATDCVVVGSHSVEPSGLNEGDSIVFNGSSWTEHNLSGAGALYGVGCLPGGRCLAAGIDSQNNALNEVWNGSTWTVDTPSGDPGLNTFACVSATTCHGVGSGAMTYTAPAATLSYAGPAYALPGGSVKLAANLSGAGAPIAGQTLSFALAGHTCSAATNASGTATCTVTAATSGGQYTVAVSWPGTTDYVPASASAQFNVVANGSYIQTPNGEVFTIAGNAPLYLNSCTPLKGCPGIVDVANLSQLATMPANGTTLSAADTGRIYKVAGGAPLYLTSCDAGCGSPVPVDQWTVDHNGTPPGGTAHLNTVPSNGTTLDAEETGRIYKVAGGAPLWLSNCDAICGSPVEVNQATVDGNGAPAGAVHHLNTYPSSGQFLTAVENNVHYRVAGGKAFRVSDCAAIGFSGCDMPGVVVNQGMLDSLGAPSGAVQHLTSTPTDGTVTQGEPSGSYWEFIGGTRQAVTARAGATVLNDAGIDTFPQGPTITQASPSSLPVTTPTTVTLKGTGFEKGAAVRLSSGVSARATNVTSYDQITVVLTVAAGTAPGTSTLTVTNPDGATASTVLTVA